MSMQPGLFSITAGKIDESYERALARLGKAGAMRRIMRREAAVYGGNAKHRAKIANRLGWVDIAGTMRRKAGEIEEFGRKAIADGFRHVIILGMGGSSLCPDLLGRVYGTRKGIKTYTVLDSTDPAAVKAAQKEVQLARTLFIVSSKSGSTVETNSQMRYFLAALAHAGVTIPGNNFVAITDRGSSLQKMARAEKFRKVFVNPSDIGGRYSALSYFGLVPAYFAGADVKALVADGYAMEQVIREREEEINPGAALGALMAGAWSEGRDKLTFFASKKTAPLVPWVEQLVAESTGKRGKGIVPIEAEPEGEAGDYGADRVYLILRTAQEISSVKREVIDALRRKGAPVLFCVLG